ncbi:MAG: hypothetical protein ED559_02780 [Phycisphaera sp.]|nr:MAG: hypothetical protein ED559_02780 [Phycisphaera sp.]
MAVTGCVCHDISFEELREIARESKCSFDELSKKTKCCTGCGMCEPYVRLMLRTGQTRFDPLPPHEAEHVIAEAVSADGSLLN